MTALRKTMIDIHIIHLLWSSGSEDNIIAMPIAMPYNQGARMWAIMYKHALSHYGQEKSGYINSAFTLPQEVITKIKIYNYY